MLLIFGVAIFVAAFLLFLVQPLIGKALLPLLGGSPAVWNACMVFFQGALLLGYLYSHVVTKKLPLKLQALLHGALLVVAVGLPLQVEIGVPDPERQPGLHTVYSDHPTLWLVYILTITVGIPFFVVSTSGPLLQHWFSRTDHAQAKDPYFLYAASNAGSALGLLSYPVLVEPRFGLPEQSRLFTAGFVVMMVGFAASIGLVLRRGREPEPGGVRTADAAAAEGGSGRGVGWRRRGVWVLLAFVPSSLMIGATQHITTDIAAIPLLWVIPLLLYLLTFMVAFSTRFTVSSAWAGRAFLFVAAAVALTVVGSVFITRGLKTPTWLLLGLHLGVVFFGALMCHRRMAEDRPRTEHLTEFYLMMSLGGVLGGLFNGLVAPVVFDRWLEYPLVMGLALAVRALLCGEAPARRLGRDDAVLAAVAAAVVAGGMVAVDRLVAPGAGMGNAGSGGAPFGMASVLTMLPMVVVGVALWVWSRRGMWSAQVAFAAAVTAGMLASAYVARGGVPLYTARTFFGVHQVVSRPAGQNGDAAWHALTHGTTTHGLQLQHAELGRLPTAYFFTTGPLGEVFKVMLSKGMAAGAAADSGEVQSGAPLSTAVLGLGCGTIAAYNRAQDSMIFFEIDPAVIHIATTREYFTYFQDGLGRRGIVQGDGRLTIAAQPDASFDLIIMDAFTSDAVPVHLITEEAFERVYLRKLKPGGLIAVNISNRHLRLAPVLGQIAKELGITGRYRFDYDVTEQERAFAKKESAWVVLARRGEDLGSIARDSRRWAELPFVSGGRAWSDEYSNILGAFDWGKNAK